LVVFVVSTAFISASSAARFYMRCWFGRKTRVLAPFRTPEGRGAARPDRLSGGADHQIAVFRPHALVGRVLAMARALASGLLVVGEPLG
jgi:hypothetical protein